MGAGSDATSSEGSPAHPSGAGEARLHEAEQALRRFQLIASETRDIVMFIRREDGHILEANAAALSAYGYDRTELLALPIRQLRAPGTAALTEGQMAAAEAGGVLFETVHRRKDGSTFPVEVSSRGAVVDGVRMLISVVRDITKRKRAEEALRRSQAELQATVEGLSEGVITSTAEGQLVHWNRAALEMHGFAAVEDLRRRLPEFESIYTLSTPEGRVLRLEEWPLSRLLRGEPVRDLEVVVTRRADGWERVFSYGGSMVVSSDGRPMAILTVRDVTERRRAVAQLADERQALRASHEALRQADRLKEDFLSMASHELRTPLTALRLQTELLRDGLRKLHGPHERTDRQLRVLDKQIDRLEKLVGVLFDASRIAEGQLRLELSEADLAEVAREAVDRLSVEAAQASVELRLDVQPVIGRWDPIRLEQVVTNLVSNAIKYGGRRPVDVSVRPREGGGVLVVRDRGIGIPLESHTLIFERFQRASNAGPVKGLGLGLWIARSMVAAHGGEIRVESAPGEGATFTVSLPRSPPAPEPSTRGR